MGFQIPSDKIMSDEDYVKHDEEICPFCKRLGDVDVSVSLSQGERKGTVETACRCKKCNASWASVFQLVGWQ